jgi:hypothetical protein
VPNVTADLLGRVGHSRPHELAEVLQTWNTLVDTTP